MRVDAAAEIMNHHSPVEVEEFADGELYLPSMAGEDPVSIRNSSVKTREGAVFWRWRPGVRLVAFSWCI